jgi:hypothetical protein
MGPFGFGYVNGEAILILDLSYMCKNRGSVQEVEIY